MDTKLIFYNMYMYCSLIMLQSNFIVKRQPSYFFTKVITMNFAYYKCSCFEKFFFVHLFGHFRLSLFSVFLDINNVYEPGLAIPPY